MKRTTGLSVVVGLSLLCGTVAGRAQSYEISWFAVDGGGGVSSGGAYSVSGTIGQADAGQLAGGSYTLHGGFWGVMAAIQPDAPPLLTVTLNPQLSTLNISWPFLSTGFVLQQTSALASPPSATLWTDVTSAAAEHVGSDWAVTISSPAGHRFFRLRKP